jgi:eukaryotic-like serine/threonine-protein kinase
MPNSDRPALTPEEWETVSAAFEAAANLHEEQQDAVVRRLCGQRDDLADLTLRMLAQEREQMPIIDVGLPAIAADMLESSRQKFETMNFGPYRLLRVLGEGGMGVVYLAEHKNNGMLVAIKILIDARLSPARRERFAHEQKMLATLDHPNIARLYHADLLENGTPWFAMEYVGRDKATSGALPIDQYCERHHATIEARLRLFAQVCGAVQHVHSKMLVHRDLKPSNILVTEDGKPKLIDFGIGKELTEVGGDVELTLPGLRLMTLAYAAPEQIRGNQALPSGDIYALGVILYELLTTRAPIELDGCTAAEAERKLIEAVPLKPSQAARQAGLSGWATAAQWRDLNALCMKAMHKEEQRRYTSAEALLRDVENYLGSRPLEARPDGSFYRASKFMHRNWRPLAIASAALVAVIAMTAFYTLRLQQARNAARAETVRTERVETFMIGLMTNDENDSGPAEQTSLAALAERGLKEARSLDRDPAIQADLYQTLGSIYQSWGKTDLSYSLLKQAYGLRHSLYGDQSVKTAESLLYLGFWEQGQDRLNESNQLLYRALAIEKAHPGADDGSTIRTLNALALNQQRQGKFRESIDALNQAMAMAGHRAEMLESKGDSITLLANDYFYMGDYERSEQLNRQGLELDRQLHGNRHPNVAEDLINLANIEESRQQLPAAERDYRQAFEILRDWYGASHPDAAEAEVYLAQTLTRELKYVEAQAAISNAIGVLEADGSSAPRRMLAIAFNAQGRIDQRMARWAEAESAYRRAAGLYAQVNGEDSWLTITALGNQASVYIDSGRYILAEQMLRDILKRCNRNSSMDPLQAGIEHFRLGRTLRLEKRYAEAEAELEKAMKLIGAESDKNRDWVRKERQELALTRQSLLSAHVPARH